MTRSACALVVLVPAVLLGLLANDIRKNLRYETQLKFHDKCTLLNTPTPCEDLTALGNGESAIAGGGDIWNTFLNGSASAADGAFWLVNAKVGSLRKLEVEGDSAPPRLLLHGIYFSQESQRLYAVNHDEAVGESVEIFDVVGTGDELKLRHVLTIRSPLFGNFQLSDVVEGEGDEIYVT